MRTTILHARTDERADGSDTENSNDCCPVLHTLGCSTHFRWPTARCLLSATLVLFLCSCGKEPQLPEQSDRPAKRVRSKKKVAGDYLPLAEGNWWKYRKRVPATDRETGKNELQCPVFTYTQTDVEDGGFVSTGSHAQLPGETVETYSVVSGPERTDDGYTGFEVQPTLTVESDSPLCFIRDGRYEDAKRVLWLFGEGREFRRPDDRRAPTVYREYIFKDIDNDLLRKPRKPPFYESGTTEGIAKHIMFLRLAEELCEVKYGKPNGDMEISASTVPEEVEVPAAKFSNCIWTTLAVKQGGPSDGKNAVSWSRTSYFAPGVGLVKETQVDAEGRVKYELALLEYHVETQESSPQPTKTREEALRELKTLHEKGLISKEVYEQKQKEILDSF